MNSVIIKDHAAFIEHNERVVPIDSLLPYLNSPISIGPNVIFDDIWHLIETDASVLGLIFREALGGFSLQMYCEQFKKPSDAYTNRNPIESMDRLEVYFGIDLETWKGENSFSMIPCLHGRGPQACTGEVVDGYWGLTFTPINDYKGYPFVINDKINLHHNVLGEPHIPVKTILEDVRVSWTVYDVLLAILDEISFMGTPQNQMQQLAEMEQRVQEVKEELGKDKGALE